MSIITVGIDLAKNVFDVIAVLGVDDNGKRKKRKKSPGSNKMPFSIDFLATATSSVTHC